MLIFICFNQTKAQAQIDQDIANLSYSFNEDLLISAYGETFFQNKESLKAAFLELINHRMTIKKVSYSVDEKYPLLGDQLLNNRYNSYSIAENEVIQPTTNPFFFHLDFFPKSIRVYRFNGTDFVLIIQPI